MGEGTGGGAQGRHGRAAMLRGAGHGRGGSARLTAAARARAGGGTAQRAATAAAREGEAAAMRREPALGQRRRHGRKVQVREDEG